MTAPDAEDAALLERIVEHADAGTRLDQALSRWLGESRSRSQERLAAGEVQVDGTVAPKSHRLVAGEQVQVAPAPAPPPPPAASAVPVRLEDEHIAVVAKPAGLVVHPGAGASGPTLVDSLAGMGVLLAPGDEPERPGIVHRLDRGTSGLLVVAKTPAARAKLVETFRRHAVERVYWALAEGVPDPPGATIDAPIARSSTNRTRFAVSPQGRRAVTHYDLTAAHGRASELRVSLETGRTHQVRVHLSAVGHPVVGDRVYGAGGLGAELGLQRPALHARRLAFDHPVTGQRVALEEPLPADLRAALRRLVGGGPDGAAA